MSVVETSRSQPSASDHEAVDQAAVPTPATLAKEVAEDEVLDHDLKLQVYVSEASSPSSLVSSGHDIVEFPVFEQDDAEDARSHPERSVDQADGQNDTTNVEPGRPQVDYGDDEWTDNSSFLAHEVQHYKALDPKALANRTFFSHCWRDKATQEKKCRIVRYLRHPPDDVPPVVYWADWLDLQAQGPVPWKMEIVSGIEGCCKFVAFLDGAYLTSYNCLQELAMAFACCKPVVPLVLNKEAWDLLTTPGGYTHAKSMADAVHSRLTEERVDVDNRVDPDLMVVSAHKSYYNSQHGPALVKFEGEEIIPGESMSMEMVRKLFSRLAAINLCPCHDQQIQAKGWTAVRDAADEYVRKELEYTKRHSELAILASKGSYLHSKDCQVWEEWLRDATENKRDPQPSPEMKEYVAQGRIAAKRRRGALLTAGAVATLLIVAGFIACLVLQANSNYHAAQARRETAMTVMQTEIAEDQRTLAEHRLRQMELKQRDVQTQTKLAEKLARAAWGLCGQRSQGTFWTSMVREQLVEAFSPTRTADGQAWIWANVSVLDLQNYGISSDEMEPIITFLQPHRTPNGTWVFNQALNVLWLTANHIGPEGARALASVLRNRRNPDGAWVFNRALQDLNLRSNDIGDEGVTALADVLTPHQNPDGTVVANSALNKLNLYNNRIGPEGAKVLATALQPRQNVAGNWVFPGALVSLNLHRNNVGPEGVAALAAAIAPRWDPNCKWVHNSAMTNLRLSDNAIGDGGAKAIAEVLEPRRNPCGTWVYSEALQVLILSKNHIGDTGALALASALQPRRTEEDKWVHNQAIKDIHLQGNDISEDVKSFLRELVGRINALRGARDKLSVSL